MVDESQTQQGESLLQQMARKRDRSQLLLDVNNAVVPHLELPRLLEAISTCLRRVLPHDFAGIALYDPGSHQLRVHALDFPEHQGFLATGDLVPVENNPSGVAFTTRRTLLVRRLDPDEFPVEVIRRIHAAGVRSGCCVPLISHNRCLGTLDVASLREGAFSEEDAELFTEIDCQIALAVENALNYENARTAERQFARERDRSTLLLEVNNAVVSHLSIPELLKAISACLRRVVPHDFAAMGFYDPDNRVLLPQALDYSEHQGHIKIGVPLPVDGTGPGLAVTSRQTVVVNRLDLAEFPAEAMQRASAEGLKSGCSVPLISHGRVLGTLDVASKREGAFSKDDAELLTQIGQQIAIAVDNALAYREIESLKNKLNEEKLYLEDELGAVHNFEEIIGMSRALQHILKQVETVAATDSTVLIQGETGTGKELIARAIHSLSARRERTLVKLNCAAIPTGLLESELFGHEKGAFTGAVAQRIGRFELANKGTLFLDEVGDIPLELQPKLLRVLQEQEFERLGSPRTQRVDVRMVAATNCDLARMVAGKQYRSDLYYRLNVFPITIPPLRERREDIPLLARFFAQKFAHRMKKPIERIRAETMNALAGYHWPGNVRELENVVERAVILSSGAELAIPIAELRPSVKVETAGDSTLESAEREHILRILGETDWVVSGPTGAAARLGMNRSTLQSRMRKLGIARPK